jgi:A/G-specific adenine glycosylase
MKTDNLEYLHTALLDYYDTHARVLPWRENKDPYRIWVSEIMLQQTQVKTVIPYYERFMNKFPNVEALALAKLDEVMKLWEGLGYYARVKHLHQTAKIIVFELQGQFPSTAQGLMKLNGIGEYTAGAIASIAFEQSVGAVDGNVHRVISRYLGLNIEKETLSKAMMNYLPKQRIGDFNQSLMEIGARICLPVAIPLCDECPLKAHCVAKINELTAEIPQKKLKSKRKIEEKTLVVLHDQFKFVIQKRPSKGLLAGLWEFPLLEGRYTEEALIHHFEKMGYSINKIQKIRDFKHLFTHIEWHIYAYSLKAVLPEIPPLGMIYASEKELNDTYTLSSLFKPYLENPL